MYTYQTTFGNSFQLLPFIYHQPNLVHGFLTPLLQAVLKFLENYSFWPKCCIFQCGKKTENFHACMHIRHSLVMHLRYFHSNSTSQIWYTASSGHCPNFEFWPKYRIFEFVINTLKSYLWSYRREIYQFCTCGYVLIIYFLPYILVFVACKSIETLFKKPPARKKLAPNSVQHQMGTNHKRRSPLEVPHTSSSCN